MMPAHSLPSSPDGAQTRVPMMDRLASRLPAPGISPFLCRIGIANEASSLAVWYDVIDRYRLSRVSAIKETGGEKIKHETKYVPASLPYNISRHSRHHRTDSQNYNSTFLSAKK